MQKNEFVLADSLLIKICEMFFNSFTVEVYHV